MSGFMGNDTHAPTSTLQTAGDAGAAMAIDNTREPVTPDAALPGERVDTKETADQPSSEHNYATTITRTSFPSSIEAGIVQGTRQSQPADVTYARKITCTSFLTTTAREQTQTAHTASKQSSSPHKKIAVFIAEKAALLQIPGWQAQSKRSGQEKASTIVIRFLLLCIIIMPLLFAASYGIGALQTYLTLRAHAQSGYQHLQAVEALFKNTHSGSMLDTQKLTQARDDFIAARTDMTQAQNLLKNSSFVRDAQQYLPGYKSQIQSATAACQIGIDVADIGQQVTEAAIVLAPQLHSLLLSNTKAPLITQDDITLIQNTMDAALVHLQDIRVQSSHISIDTLPLNDHQKALVRQFLGYLPQVQNNVALVQSLLGSANWLLGVNQPRTFLVQTLDSSELRATGGFTGQYGELYINGGRVAPFSLHDVGLLEDYSPTDPTVGNEAPAAYRSWWPFANWGLRDSNLSADYPTSAKLAIERYQAETHNHVDGVISFTPVLIEHVLQVAGPLNIPEYGETITAQNLEDRLHYYQLDNKGIRKEEIVEHVSDPGQARKLFTSRLAHVLTDHIRQASPSELLALGKQLMSDLKTKDLQVYVTNPQVESLLEQYHYAAQMDLSATHDGLYIVQMNLSASKASQYVTTTTRDTVKLDASGGALHQLQMRLVYGQRGPVYGLDTYRDYIRFYVPPQAQFKGGDGFDSGKPLCGGVLETCPATNVYPHNELICPPGQYDAGAAAPMLNDPYAGEYHPLDTVGPPTNFKSDMPGRGMFGGWVVIPKNCTATITVSWYVPTTTPGEPYELLVQRQASMSPQFNLDVQPAPGSCLNGYALISSSVLEQDTVFILDRNQVIRNRIAQCTLLTTTP